jgi:hypothetical protein
MKQQTEMLNNIKSMMEQKDSIEIPTIENGIK